MHRFAAALIFVLLVTPVAGAATTGATGPVLLKTKVIIDECMFTRKDGSVVISEGDNGRVIVIKPDGSLYTLVGKR